MLADRAAALGIEVRCHRVFDGDPVPPAEAIERLVVMGGPMSASDDDAYPWIGEIRARLAQLVENGTPVLGVCLGAQLLASSLGAAVYAGDAPEIGVGSVSLAPAARDDPLLGTVEGDVLGVFHWHGDTFDLPKGATLLASNERYVNQAFRVANAWGLQFHIELRASDATVVTSHLVDAAPIDAGDLAAIEPVGARIIDAFLGVPTPDEPNDS